ncbi:MAG TPA: molybdenum cofactor guanylyltransferase [Pyrinomonadaceae bacterium]|jgi:molybdopterin-guanine dinucleotide biosynthesis protein A
MPEIEGFILAGGASSRMGTDKARLPLDGRSLVERVAGALSRVVGRVSVVSSKADAGAWGLPVVADIHEGCGALGGIHAALAHAEASWAAIVSCDLPFVTGELFARLKALRETEEAGGDAFDAVAPLQPDGRAQPLCALYARRPALEEAERLLRSGELRPRVLLARLRTRWVEPAELADLPNAALFFLNVNTPEDYADALRRTRDGARA